MTAAIHSYQPRVKIIVRHSLDISSALGDVGSAVVHKDLYSPAGEFHINLPDMPWKGQRESLYGIIDPMDPIEIFIRRARDGVGQSAATWVPVLRGFVRSVGRHEQIGGDGRPQRMVVIAGNDCGAAFIMEQIFAIITWYATGFQGIKEPFAFLLQYGLSEKPTRIADFIWDAATKPTKLIMDNSGFSFDREFSVKKGYALPILANTGEGPLWEFLDRYVDRPWNEFFVREGSQNPQLVFRPTPWRDYGDGWLPDANESQVQFFEIDQKDIVSLIAHRDDSELVQWAAITSGSIGAGANTFPLEDRVLQFNTGTGGKFGDRIQRLETILLPDDYDDQGLPEDEQIKSQHGYANWLSYRVRWVKDAGEDIHKFERGQITVKGRPEYRIGDYIRVKRGAIIWEAYVTSVTHDYQPYRRYMTTMEYIRGTQYRERKGVANPWDVERKRA